MNFSDYIEVSFPYGMPNITLKKVPIKLSTLLIDLSNNNNISQISEKYKVDGKEISNTLYMIGSFLDKISS